MKAHDVYRFEFIILAITKEKALLSDGVYLMEVKRSQTISADSLLYNYALRLSERANAAEIVGDTEYEASKAEYKKIEALAIAEHERMSAKMKAAKIKREAI